MKKVTVFTKEYIPLRDWMNQSGLSKEDAFEILKATHPTMVIYHNKPCLMGAEVQKINDKPRCT